MENRPAERVVLVAGATGKQGGAVLRHLKGTGLRPRAVTRKPGEGPARALESRGIEVVQGDFDTPLSLRPALDGAWGAFAVQNTWEAGVEREETQGKDFARAARAAGVEHFVYSSVASAQRQTGIPHFENKWRVEEVVRAQGFPSHTIIRPVFFMENLISPWFLNGDQIVSALNPDTKLQMVAVDDVGRLGAAAFERPEEFRGREIDLAGDSVTMKEAVEGLSDAFGRRIEYVQIPIEDIRKNSEDFASMLEWFERVGYNADIEGVSKTYGLKLTNFVDWAKGQKATS